MQSSSDLRKLVTTAISKTEITDLIRGVSKSTLPEPQKRQALAALSDAFVAISKEDETGALAHVQRARAIVARSARGGGR